MLGGEVTNRSRFLRTEEVCVCVLQVIRRYSDFDVLNSSLMVGFSLSLHHALLIHVQCMPVTTWRKFHPDWCKLRLSQSPSCWESSLAVHSDKPKRFLRHWFPRSLAWCCWSWWIGLFLLMVPDVIVPDMYYPLIKILYKCKKAS